MNSADLHLHTNFSDGTYTPEELTGRARQLGLAAVALTDHDTVEGCTRMAAACAAAGLEFIPATELTAEFDDNELHLLGYFVDTGNQTLLTEMVRFQKVRQDRVREMVARLNQLNIPLEADAVFALASCRSPGRPHVARALVMGRFCSSPDEAFERFLKKNRPAWVPKFKISALDAIALIHQAGGLAVMAHPGLNRTDGIIPDLVEAGLDGLECFHTKHTPSTSEHYVRIAKEFNLAITGGSDCHGLSKGKPLIGTVRLPYEYVEQLQARSRSKRSRAPAPRPALRAPH
ncbi:MAG TPA: PHP domain-containing protein [Haliangiales bacterium]|nr:PHP domain-containing protein [Haliangiales bacterium]